MMEVFHANFNLRHNELRMRRGKKAIVEILNETSPESENFEISEVSVKLNE